MPSKVITGIASSAPAAANLDCDSSLTAVDVMRLFSKTTYEVLADGVHELTFNKRRDGSVGITASIKSFRKTSKKRWGMLLYADRIKVTSDKTTIRLYIADSEPVDCLLRPTNNTNPMSDLEASKTKTFRPADAELFLVTSWDDLLGYLQDKVRWRRDGAMAAVEALVEAGVTPPDAIDYSAREKTLKIEWDHADVFLYENDTPNFVVYAGKRVLERGELFPGARCRDSYCHTDIPINPAFLGAKLT